MIGKDGFKTPSNAQMSIFRLIPAVFGLVILSLALYKVIVYWRTSSIDGQSLIQLIVKDQTIYYFMYVFSLN